MEAAGLEGLAVGGELREYLRPDPRGYYVIPVARHELDRIPESLVSQVEVEWVSATECVVKTRSRSVAKKILALLKRIPR
jgi:hypothetical protein